MQKKLVLISAYLIITVAGIFTIHSLQIKHQQAVYRLPFMPKPTETPGFVKEEKDSKTKREKWFEAMHRAAPGVDWRAIELQNQKEKAKSRAILRKQNVTRSTIEYLADSTLQGQWYERGAKNQAGSMVYTDYDPETDYLYSVAAGGSIFKGTSEGADWHALNQEYKFDERFIRIFNGPAGKRITCVLNKQMVNSDDDGQTWSAASGQNNASEIDRVKDFLILKDADNTAMYLAREKASGNAYTIRLYISKDKGSSYTLIKDFGNRPLNELTITNPGNTNDVYLIEKISQLATAIHKWDFVNNDFVKLNQANFSIGGSSSFKVTSAWMTDHVRFYLYNSTEFVHYTDDYGVTWVNKGKLAASPWGVGIFAFPSDPKKLLMGEVECYRSNFEGSIWQKINGWGEYYSKVKTKLHADMMHFNEFQKADGTNFGVICCHGGIYTTKDYGKTVTNITLEHLNNAQYYDVVTQPGTFDYIYAGAQDQGFQRAQSNIDDKSAADFVQVISGDYGHSCFTKGGSGLWTVYPGGSISFYNNPKSQGGPTAYYELDSDNETVWIPPIIPGPNNNAHEVFLAGGNKDGGAGSHLIKLTYKQGTIDATQFEFDFKANSGSEISAMAISPFDSTIYYVATNNGKFYISPDAGASFFESSPKVPGSHYLYGACIYPSKLNPDVIYLSGSGYSNSGVLVSTDGGFSFNPLGEGLPKTFVFNVVANEDESLLFAATEAGPYVYSVAKQKWFDMSGIAAPTQTFWSVEYIPGHKVVRFGTYGRGIWDFRIDDLTTSVAQYNSDNSLLMTIAPNPARNFLNITLPQDETFDVEIFNMNGQVVLKPGKINLVKNINVQALLPGNYIIKASSKKRNISKIFVKQ